MQEVKRTYAKPPQEWLDLINQIFEIEKKLSSIKEENSINRNISKLKSLLKEGFFKGGGMTYHNPLGENYTDTRTDCQATISGTSVQNLGIIEVVKPIIFYAYQENNKIIKTIVQPAVVIVQSKNPK